MKCNGCGIDTELLAAVFGYENVSVSDGGAVGAKVAYADYMKTLCPRCQHVLKDILVSSDLSEHWHKYEWSLIGDEYTEPYDE